MSDFRMVPEYRGRVRACVFDWAGMFTARRTKLWLCAFWWWAAWNVLGTFTYDVRNILVIPLVTVTLMPPISTFQPLIVRTLYVNVPFTNDSG